MTKLSPHKTLDEVMAEHDAYIQTKQYKIDHAIHRIKNFLKSPLRWKNNIKWAYQRVTRGFSDADAWNGDNFLAKNIAGIMDWIVVHGHSVSTAYADDGWDTPIEVMVDRRDADYIKYGAIFSEYAKEGVAFDEEWKEKFGGVLDTEIEEALQWLSKHFTGLWD